MSSKQQSSQGTSRRQLPRTARGFDRFQCVSAVQKAIRRGDADTALYFAEELNRSDLGAWCWARLRVIASEDVGLAEPGIASEIRALYENWLDGKRDWLFLAHATWLLVTAPKSRAVCHAALVFGLGDEGREVPDVALDMHTRRGKRSGRGYRHFFEEAARLHNESNDVEDRYATAARAACETTERPMPGTARDGTNPTQIPARDRGQLFDDDNGGER